MEPFSITHAKLLYCRFSVIYGDKFVKANHDNYFKSIWYEEWTSGMTGICVSAIKDALAYCKINLDWSPSIAEFRRICENANGVPSSSAALQSAIRREFNHPIVSIAYEKVGSWAMKNDKEGILAGKFQVAYTEALNEFRVAPNKAWEILEKANKQCALPEPLSKIPSAAECKKFSERLVQYREMAKEAKSKLEAKDHPTWPKEAITMGHGQFNESIYNERRSYLLKTDEYLAGTLSRDDWYDRIRYKRELEAQEAIKNNKPRVDEQVNEKTQQSRYSSPRSVYNNWNN